MKLSSDGKYKLFADCANDVTTGATVAAWNAHNHTPNPNYPGAAAFLARYGSEIPVPEPTPVEGKSETQILKEQYAALLVKYTQLEANVKQFYTDVAATSGLTVLNIVNENKAAANKGLNSAPYK